MQGEKRLALAVLEKAYLDATCSSNEYEMNQARKFLTASNFLWEKSLKAWCNIADIDSDKIIKKSREMWYNK